jgi:hypothetical protein
MLIVAFTALVASAGVAHADPISAIILTAIGGPALAANTIALAITSFAITTVPSGRGLIIGRRKP